MSSKGFLQCSCRLDLEWNGSASQNVHLSVVETGINLLVLCAYTQRNGVENICLFTCVTAKSVHLEIIMDLTTDTFLLAL